MSVLWRCYSNGVTLVCELVSARTSGPFIGLGCKCIADKILSHIREQTYETHT